VTDEIETLAKADDSCRRVMTVPGIGPIISSAMVAAIGNGSAFSRGRDYSAWLGLVPKQMSTGDRTILGRISKRGNSYLRMLFIQAARVILLRPANWPKHGFGAWLVRAIQRLHPNVLAAALANKLARIAWTVLAQERSYEARVMKAEAAACPHPEPSKLSPKPSGSTAPPPCPRLTARPYPGHEGGGSVTRE
jgi:transposase